jgi:hypothetical protein
MLSYALPSKWTDAMKMKSARIFIQGENLALLSKYPGWDPEVCNSTDPSLYGNVQYAVPAPSIYKIGVNLTF